jgi:hypothetical protein
LRAAGLVGTLLLVALPAHADDARREQAKEAYDRGLDAHKHGEMARAAKEFATADALQPSAQALQAALDAAIDADDVALGAELLERAKREPATPGLASSITAATMKFNARAGRLKIVCPAGASCSAKVDENPVGVGRALWVPIGQRTVSVQVDGRSSVNKVVDISADTPLEVTAGKELTAKPGSFGADSGSEPTQGPPSRATQREGLSPVVFYAGAGITVALAAFSTYLMVHTSSIHGDFDDKNCTRVQSKECTDLSDSGKSSQSAANIALVLTGVAALATVAIGVGFVNWRSGKTASRNPFVLTF